MPIGSGRQEMMTSAAQIRFDGVYPERSRMDSGQALSTVEGMIRLSLAERGRIRTAPMGRAEDSMAPNKANPGRGGLGIDEGLRIIDDLQPQTPGAALCQTKPMSAFLARKWGAMGETDPIGTQDGRCRGGAGSSHERETRRAKQSQFRCRVDGGHGPACDAARQAAAPNKANLRVPARQTKPMWLVVWP